MDGCGRGGEGLFMNKVYLVLRYWRLGLRCGKILDGDWYIVKIVEGVGLLVVLNKELLKFVDM